MADHQADYYYKLGKIYLAKAIAADGKDKYNEAIVQYDLACENFIAGLKFDKRVASRQLVIKRVKSYLTRAELLQATLREQTEAQRLNQKNASAKPLPDDGGQDNGWKPHKLKGSNAKEDDGITFDDVAGLGGVKSILKETVMLPMLQPHIFQGARKPFRGILLYGPPGTGKTLVAKALAGESKTNFISLSSADIVSKAQGESERAIRAVFEYARQKKPCVIFFDEIDSIGGLRSDASDGQHSESMRRVLTELLRQLDGVGTQSNEGVTLVAATNLPFELDPALRRRFEKRVYVPLPDERTRAKVLGLHLGRPGDTHRLARADLERAAGASEGCSNADLAVAAKEALMAPVRRCMKSSYFREVPESSWSSWFWKGRTALVPCSAGDPGAIRMRMMDPEFDAQRLKVPLVTAEDLDQAIAHLRPTVTGEMLTEYEAFTAKFGEKHLQTTDEGKEDSEGESDEIERRLPEAPTGSIKKKKSKFGVKKLSGRTPNLA